jgi:hypothetical protein
MLITPIRRGCLATDVLWLRCALDVRLKKFECDLPYTEVGWRSRAVEFRRLKRAGAVGGIEVLTIDLRRPGDGFLRPSCVGFDAKLAQLFVVPKAQLEGFLACPVLKATPPGCMPSVYVHHNPYRHDLPRLVARLCKYPPSLLRGDAFSVLDYLEARRGNQMVAGFGTLALKKR